MIGFTIKTKGKGKMKVSAPSAWSEITYAQLIKIETEWDGKDLIRLFGILIDMEFEEVSELTDPELEKTLYEVCQFVFIDTPSWDTLKRPNQIMWEGRMVTVPTAIRQETLAQKIMINSILKSEDTVMEAIPKAVAVYMHPVLERGSLMNQEVIKIVTEKLKLRNAVEVYSIGNFFLKKLGKPQRLMLLSLVQRSPTRLKNSQIQNRLNRMKTSHLSTDLSLNMEVHTPTTKS